MTLSYMCDFILYFIILGIGIDFAVSGLIFKGDVKELRKPKLLGLLILKLNQGWFERMRKLHSIFHLLYSLQSIRFLTFAAGVLIIVGSTIAIIGLLF